MPLFSRKQQDAALAQGLEKTRTGLFARLGRVIQGRRTIDQSVLDDLEEALLTGDVGVPTTLHILDRVRKSAARKAYVSTSELDDLVREAISGLLQDGATDRPVTYDSPLHSRPHIVLVVGVNGVGKTTTIGKLAWQYRQHGKRVLLGAADTFRAAAIEQLEVWARRADAELVKQRHGSDPAAVAYDAVDAAHHRGMDIALIDTAGRLHTKSGLMDELSKIRRVIGKRIPEAPHEVLLVLDASIGQNAMRQAEVFTRSVDVTGLVITKLDGTARGGIVIGISNEFKVPVKYIGVGERLEDLQIFDRHRFAQALTVA